MTKWIVTSETENPSTLINAVCRYLNSTNYPDKEVIVAILGIEEIEVPKPEKLTEDKPCTEE